MVCINYTEISLSTEAWSKMLTFSLPVQDSNASIHISCSVSKSGPVQFSASKLGNQQLDQFPSYLKWKQLQLDCKRLVFCSPDQLPTDVTGPNKHFQVH